MGGNDAVAQQPRRTLPLLVFLTIVAASPEVRKALANLFRRLLDALHRRLSGYLRPAVRKDFLQGAAGAGATPFASAIAPARGASQQWSQWEPKSRATEASPLPEGAEFELPEPVEGHFSQFGSILPPWLSEGLRRGGFEKLKPIQRQILPLALAGKDVCGVAPTGSGKTLAFLVPGLVHAAGQPPLRGASDGPIVLVLAPTRELAVQIGRVAEGLMKPSWDMSRKEGMVSAVIYGGARRTDQLQTLRFQQRTHLIVATPGRLLDFLEHGAFTLKRVSFFVLDEGDRMLDFGFEPDVTEIARQVRSDRQMVFFSATWPAEVDQCARRLCFQGQSFEKVSVQPADAEIEGGAEGGGRVMIPGRGGLAVPPREIKQVVEVISGGDGSWHFHDNMETKVPLLLRHLDGALGGEIGETPGKALIFVGTRVAAEEIGELVARHFGLGRCGVMHGQRKQEQREATLQSFRTGRIRALVATDVLGRGVDIPKVTHVVIYDFPGDIETYIHRVGRTGRNGEPGTAISFFEPRPWYPEISKELVSVLRACEQEVPAQLEKEAGTTGKGAYDDWGDGWWGTEKKEDEEPKWVVDEASWRKAPPLESTSPGLATEKELAEWNAAGARVWAYSANGGRTEQGRLELRSGGKLRTTWGWGEWALLPSAPPCPRPSRPCPTAPAPEKQGETVKPADVAAGGREAAPAAPASKPAAPHLSLSWGGCTDVCSLDATGLGFELVSRSGRAASTYKSKTVGKALPGVAL